MAPWPHDQAFSWSTAPYGPVSSLLLSNAVADKTSFARAKRQGQRKYDGREANILSNW